MNFKLRKYGTENNLIRIKEFTDCFTTLTDRKLEKIGIFKSGTDQNFLVSDEEIKNFSYSFHLTETIENDCIALGNKIIYFCDGYTINLCESGIIEIFNYIPEKIYIKEIL